MGSSLQLGITKIGDLLRHNKITLDHNGKEIGSIALTIPNYQRPYKWTSKNAIQLLDDILEAKNQNKETYRVGTLILHKDSDKYNIVDGQQRTITFSLLLKALGESEVDFLNQSMAYNPHNQRNIPNNYLSLERRIQNMADEREKKDLKEYVENNCELITVITDSISDAFQFFDSQNARGKKLYPHDLLKAYHLREMADLDITETERIVKEWEDLPQQELALLFSDYLYRVKEWTKGNWAWELTEQNIHKFKGITRKDNHPFAQFFKGAFSFAESMNRSAMPFVSGTRNLKSFQLDTPIIAGKPFFEFAKHYFETLRDIKNNDKYEGYFINGNEIVKTLDLRTYKNGVGNRITRLLFDTTILLYVDRFCPEKPSKADLEMLEQFVVCAFIWSYSLRAQYKNLGWHSAQNYIMGKSEVLNSFNLYKTIADSDSPLSLLGTLSEKLISLPMDKIEAKKDNIDATNDDQIHLNYLHFFKAHKFLDLI
jgi:hypothetical protein